MFLNEDVMNELLLDNPDKRARDLISTSIFLTAYEQVFKHEAEVYKWIDFMKSDEFPLSLNFIIYLAEIFILFDKSLDDWY